jgi:transposase
MSGLITNPAAIWLAVEPVDMRRGIDGLSVVVQQALGHAPAQDRRLSFVTGPAIASRWWSGMALGYGYASAACIKAALFGPKSAMHVFW